MGDVAWIAVDWGTSHVRAWLMRADGTVLDRRSSAQGMGALERSGFEPALRELIGDALPAPVLACGMVGSRQGWAEAPYAAVPCAPPAAAEAVRVTGTDLDVRILPGVKQVKPADVMRGEETQIAGFLATSPGFDGVICLPGTHTKWVQVSAGEIVSFRTAMTGEMFALLSERSVLRHSMGDGWDGNSFAAGVDQSLSRPEGLAAALFSLRAEGLLHGLSGDAARARLSGLLVGAELASMRPYWLGQQVALIGAEALSQAYAEALGAQGVPTQMAGAEEMTLAGLTAAYTQIYGEAA
ncbi:2-dehydro-3-deoxygalactonokinase [Tateyamaria sp. ANG-S1]|uniref:2-dehydro-3-deoxygalactonokinase n=1 Tax=Tateyamaria sp. ANG-S1 TaxID=1577905 RepID=UPI00057DF719|nr:2-dehydro-3-deoxygalactonokinase [Tateyamaria sp. ANG-S1]KIC51128.1 2-keto-3-deoxy-galactonokinase [Tateyamaria sp. ANG-S1]